MRQVSDEYIDKTLTYAASFLNSGPAAMVCVSAERLYDMAAEIKSLRAAATVHAINETRKAIERVTVRDADDVPEQELSNDF